MKSLLIIILLYVIVAFSCNNETLTKNDLIDTLNSQADKNVIIKDDANDSNPSSNNTDTIAYILLPNLTFVVTPLVVRDEKQYIDHPNTDAVNLYAKISETKKGQQISFSTNKLTGITVDQSFETSVTISNEGPHCDLKEWKHYRSGWKPLKKSTTGKFIGLTYDINETKKFPKVSIHELKEKVREHCGEEWYHLVKNIQTPYEYPGNIGISRYFLRVNAKIKSNGKTFSKIIAIELPMGG